MRPIFALAIVSALVACTSGSGTNSANSPEAANEALAVQKIGCAFENQTRCDHLIENRALFARFFLPPPLGGMDESEKTRGRRITTKFVVEAAAAIKQCKPVTAESITLIKDMQISGGKYLVKGTSPLTMSTSSCFITPQVEES